jgi:hypothetical protein
VQKQPLAIRLLEYIRGMPPELNVINSNGNARAYDFQLAQLHSTLLTAITILYRPSSIFNIAPLYFSAISITASNLNVKIFEAIELRNHTHCLSSAFTWFMLVTAIPHLSALCCVPTLSVQSNYALDTIENVLQTFSRVRTSAVNNLANVRAIRKAVSVPRSNHADLPNGRREQERSNIYTTSEVGGSDSMPFELAELLRPYGTSALKNYESNMDALRILASSSTVLQDPLNVQSDTRGQIDHGPLFSDWATPAETYFPFPGANPDASNLDFQLLVGDDFQESGWMRDWVDDLQLFGSDV